MSSNIFTFSLPGVKDTKKKGYPLVNKKAKHYNLVAYDISKLYMSRRTRKEKERTAVRRSSESLTVSWDPKLSASKSEASVKGQFNGKNTSPNTEAKNSKNADFSANNLNLASIKKNITMSLVFSGLILASEVVLYFVLK